MRSVCVPKLVWISLQKSDITENTETLLQFDAIWCFMKIALSSNLVDDVKMMLLMPSVIHLRQEK